MDFNPVSAGRRLLVVGFGHPVCGKLPTERFPQLLHNLNNFLHYFQHFFLSHNLHGRICCGSNGFTIDTILHIVGWLNGGKLFLKERGKAGELAVALAFFMNQQRE
jgi:hypothetical protein